MKCPVCGAVELIHDTRDIPYTYKGETTSIPAVTGDFCPACAESVLDATESDRVMQEMRAFSKQVNAAIVDPKFIAAVRKKLMLDQREAAEIFGGGANAFSRYENGKTKPPLSLVKLLKVLDRHPDLLNEVKMA
jgi:HTH-type transcriptional regulator / antitoxin MqsA